MSAQPSIVKINLAPCGQDFHTFFVEAGRIVHVVPEQGWAWRGKVLDAVEFAPGDALRLKGGPLLSYTVSRVRTIRPKMTYDNWLARVDFLARREAGVDCFTAESGAQRRGDPWIGLYLAEMTPEQAFAKSPVPLPA